MSTKLSSTAVCVKAIEGPGIAVQLFFLSKGQGKCFLPYSCMGKIKSLRIKANIIGAKPTLIGESTPSLSASIKHRPYRSARINPGKWAPSPCPPFRDSLMMLGRLRINQFRSVAQVVRSGRGREAFFYFITLVSPEQSRYNQRHVAQWEKWDARDEESGMEYVHEESEKVCD